MIDMIDTDESTALSMALTTDILCFVRNDLLSQQAVTFHQNSFVLTETLNNHKNAIVQDIQHFLLEDTAPLGIKQQALKSAISLYQGQGGLVENIVSQNNMLKHNMEHERARIKKQYEDGRQIIISENVPLTMAGAWVSEDTRMQRRMRANQLKKEYEQSLEAIKINLPKEVVQDVILQCVRFLLKNAREHIQELNIGSQVDTVHISSHDTLLKEDDYPNHPLSLFLNIKKEQLSEQPPIISSKQKHAP